MSKFDDTKVTAIEAKFEDGDIPSDSDFALFITAVRDGIQEHEHVTTGGAGEGTGDAAPARGALLLLNARAEICTDSDVGADTGFATETISDPGVAGLVGALLLVYPEATTQGCTFSWRKKGEEDLMYTIKIPASADVIPRYLYLAVDSNRQYEYRINPIEGGSADLTQYLIGHHF